MSGYFSTLDPKFVKNRKLIFVNYEKDEFYLCSFNLDNCNKQKINRNEKDLANILSQRFTRINNILIDSPATKVSKNDKILVNNIEVPKPSKTRIWRFHKPKGCLVTNYDPKGRTTIFNGNNGILVI